MGALTPQAMADWAKGRGFEVASDASLPGQLLVQDLFGSGIPVRAAFFDEQGVAWVQVELSQVVDPDRFREVSLAIVLLNASIFLGSWNLKTSKGKLYFKVAAPTAGTTYSGAAIESLFKTVVQTVMGTGPKLLKVAMEGAGAESVRQ